MFLKLRRARDLVDLVDFHVEFDVLAQLLDHDPVPLELFDDLGVRGRNQVGVGPADRERRFRAAHVNEFVFLRLVRADAAAVLLLLDEAEQV